MFSRTLLRISRHLSGLTAVNTRPFPTLHISKFWYSNCCNPINEPPIMDNDGVMASNEEARLRDNLETTITVPTMVDLTPVNGIPKEYLLTRRARIFQPAKNAMQSGPGNVRYWQLEFDNRLRWENPLMGWTSSADSLSVVKVYFNSPDEAINFCAKNGWMWYVDSARPQEELKRKSYAENFSWNKRTRISTK